MAKRPYQRKFTLELAQRSSFLTSDLGLVRGSKLFCISGLVLVSVKCYRRPKRQRRPALRRELRALPENVAAAPSRSRFSRLENIGRMFAGILKHSVAFLAAVGCDCSLTFVGSPRNADQCKPRSAVVANSKRTGTHRFFEDAVGRGFLEGRHFDQSSCVSHAIDIAPNPRSWSVASVRGSIESSWQGNIRSTQGRTAAEVKRELRNFGYIFATPGRP